MRRLKLLIGAGAVVVGWQSTTVAGVAPVLLVCLGMLIIGIVGWALSREETCMPDVPKDTFKEWHRTHPAVPLTTPPAPFAGRLERNGR